MEFICLYDCGLSYLRFTQKNVEMLNNGWNTSSDKKWRSELKQMSLCVIFMSHLNRKSTYCMKTKITDSLSVTLWLAAPEFPGSLEDIKAWIGIKGSATFAMTIIWEYILFEC